MVAVVAEIRNETILLVEKDEAVRRLVHRVLELQGYGVLEARSPIDALVLLRGSAAVPNLLVTEVLPSEMTGFELVDRIALEFGQVPALYSSAGAEAPSRRLGRKESVLQKPFGMNELLARVRRALDQAGVPEAAAPDHLAKLYRDPSSLAEAVARFILGGLWKGEGVVAIVEPAHWAQISGSLADQGADVRGAEHRGELLVIDAPTVLGKIWTGSGIDGARFDDLFGGAIRSMRGQRPGKPLRIFGEMVDLLCQSGRVDAALQLDDRWNEMMIREPRAFRLLCGFGMDALGAEGGLFHSRVCDGHSHTVPAGV